MDRTEILDNAESLFGDAGFYLSQRCCARPSCFDFAARKETQVVFLKVNPNIGNIYEKDADGLNTLARAFSGSPLLICERTRDKPLEDDTVYSRYNVGAITLNTLRDTLLKGSGPLIEAGPGGYYVSLDWEAIRKKRWEKGLSMGKIAEIMGVSKRTLYGYERGSAKASVETAYKLEWVWGIPVVKPLDIFSYPEGNEGLIATARRIISGSRFLQFVVKKLIQFNFAVFHLKRAPFDFVARNSEDEICLIGAVAHENERRFDVRTEEIISVSKILEAQPVFVTDSKRVCVENVPLICREDLERINCSEDLMAIL